MNIKNSLFIIIFVIGTIIIISFLTDPNSLNYFHLNYKEGLQTKDIYSKDLELCLRDCYVKSAYNCCSPNGYNNDTEIEFFQELLKQGVRFLDFQLFSINDQPVVSTSTSNNDYIMDNKYIVFSDIINSINSYAFEGAYGHNSDFLILHLRIQSNNQKMYSNLAKNLLNISSQHNKFISKCSVDNKFNPLCNIDLMSIPISKLKSQVIIIIDETNASFKENKELLPIIAGTSGSREIWKITSTNLLNDDKTEMTNHNGPFISIVTPDTTATNPASPNIAIANSCGCQFVCMNYGNVKDPQFVIHNTRFFQNNTSIVPKDNPYVKTTIPDPTPAPKNYSYAPRTTSLPNGFESITT